MTETAMTETAMDSMFDKLAATLRAEISKVVAEVKASFIGELAARDARILALEEELAAQKQLLPPVQPAKQVIDVVIAGDSIVKHVDVKSELPSAQIICVPGAKGHAVHRAVNTLAETTTIKQLVLHFGTNNIPTDFAKACRICPPDAIAGDIIQTLQNIQLQHPTTKLHFSALLPKVDRAFNQGIDNINYTVHNFCAHNDIGFVKHEDFCTDGRFKKDYFAPREWRERRALHPSEDGAKYISANIIEHLKK
jgi:hypothetical protein